MKILLLTIVLLIPQSSQAEIRDNLSGNINLSSNYTYRGINRHSSNRVLSGNLEYASKTGLYGGVWIGNYKTLWSNEPDTETDLYLGFSHNLKFGNSIDTSFWRGTYNQKTARDYDWVEWQISYHYHDRWGFMLAIADNLYGSDQRSTVAELNFVHQTKRLTLVISLGKQQFESRFLSDVNYLHTRVSLDWRQWHLFLNSSFTDLKSDSAAFSRNWKTRSHGVGLAYSF